ncbi:hypothetical protein acdb102_41950 [Acidothermaceae bacterium B102]|nr:hypothetical protein acdb102_41950 [Acidothermaceae bacterium B102]
MLSRVVKEALSLWEAGGEMSGAKEFVRGVLSVRAAPMLVGYALVPRARWLIDRDVERWQEVKRRDESGVRALLLLLTTTTHEFRNLYYHRLSHAGVVGLVLSKVLGFVYRPEATLFMRTNEIGPGLFLQHAFSTTIGAQSIGANCWVNQQVTIGYDSFLAAPIIEDNVVVSAGAIVIGGVTLGAGAHIGAGAVVTKDVPAGMVAVGVPAKSHAPGRNARAHGPQRAPIDLGWDEAAQHLDA